MLSLIYTVDRCIFSITGYQLSFFFEDKKGWIFQENENTCYRVSLRAAFCTPYLVILTFKEAETSKVSWKKQRLIVPIFFDSLPAQTFRQLRKVIILLGYV